MSQKRENFIRIVITAAVWLIWLRTGRPWGLILPLVGTAIAFGVIGREKADQNDVRETERAAPPSPPRSAPERSGASDGELDDILRESQMALNELSRLYALIPSDRVRKLTMQLMELTNGMAEDGKKDRNDFPVIRRYFARGIPVAIRLLQEYDSRGEEKTAALLSDLLETYRSQYDELFQNDAMDIENEISAMEAKLSSDGLKPSDFGGN